MSSMRTACFGRITFADFFLFSDDRAVKITPGGLFPKNKRNPGVSTCYYVSNSLSSHLIPGHDSPLRRLDPRTHSIKMCGKVDQCVPRENRTNPNRTWKTISSDLGMCSRIPKAPVAQGSDVAMMTPATAILDLKIRLTSSRGCRPVPASILRQSQRVPVCPLGIPSIVASRRKSRLPIRTARANAERQTPKTRTSQPRQLSNGAISYQTIDSPSRTTEPTLSFPVRC